MVSLSVYVDLQPGNSNMWFEGVHLLPLLHRVLSLPSGPETDLLENLDRFAHTSSAVSPNTLEAGPAACLERHRQVLSPLSAADENNVNALIF